MRTKSSRLFLVLLHLVSVSTDIGGVNTNPRAILLERIQLQKDRLEGFIQHEGDDALAMPFWLQDDVDGLCLSPAGFSQCGETTLWYLREVAASSQQTKRRRRRRSTYDNLSYALEYVEPSRDGECLLQSKHQKNNNNNNKLFKTIDESLGPCQSSPLDRVFSWNVNERGVLYKPQSTKKLLASQQEISHQCLWRTVNATNASLASCTPNMDHNHHINTTADDDVDDNNDDNNDAGRRRLAQISLVRYLPASVVQERETRILQAAAAAATLAAAAAEQNHVANNSNETTTTIPRSKDSAHRHATEPLHHHTTKVKQPSSANNKKPLGSVVKKTTAGNDDGANKKKKLFTTLKDTNPILFIGDHHQQQQQQRAQQEKTTKVRTTPSLSAATYKLRRLETHPYIASSQNDVWTDPQTGLGYRTDLCAYLGHDLKTAGRHTLTGVGYYTKTVLNIKIYGVALYISKRDVLADPAFEQYATMATDDLRGKKEFYEHLREMPSPHDPKSGLVDRTILLKLNMQLSVETMQSSLRATWQLLTDERKDLLINSSMMPRPAKEGMLQTIQSSKNPGRCSCGQVAPPEYNADRDCCARGTELVFTWRKSGDLEIRVDGEMLDSFPRPDVARGIFYEYLRTDDPISPDFTNRVVDGFPFLLGPLAHINGMPAAIQMNDAHKQERGPGKGVGNFADVMSSHAGDFAGWLATGAVSNAGFAASNVANAAKSLGSTASSVKEGLERRRDQLWNQVSALPETSKHLLHRLHYSRRPDELSASVAHYMKRRRRGDIQMKRKTIAPRGRVFRSSVNQWFGVSEENADELDNTITNTSFFGNLIFLYLVHLYLLLLLIVSLPDPHQTKYVVRRSKTLDDTMMDDDDSTESSSTNDSPMHSRRLSSDTWTIGNESISNRQPRKNLISLLKEKRHRSRSPVVVLEEEAPSSPTTGMKKSLSFYL